MADIVFNQGLGRIVELAHRVNNNDPTDAAIILAALGSAAADSVLKDLDTLAAIEANGSTAEATNSGYARKTITTLTVTVDDTNDRTDVDYADQTWTGVAASPGAWTDLLNCYDGNTGGGSDSDIVPLTLHDFAVTPDGSDITAQLNAAGFFRAA